MRWEEAKPLERMSWNTIQYQDSSRQVGKAYSKQCSGNREIHSGHNSFSKMGRQIRLNSPVPLIIGVQMCNRDSIQGPFCLFIKKILLRK